MLAVAHLVLHVLDLHLARVVVKGSHDASDLVERDAAFELAGLGRVLFFATDLTVVEVVFHVCVDRALFPAFDEVDEGVFATEEDLVVNRFGVNVPHIHAEIKTPTREHKLIIPRNINIGHLVRVGNHAHRLVRVSIDW